MATIIFGNDLNDVLLLSNWSHNNFFKDFEESIRIGSRDTTNLFRGIFYNDLKLLKRCGYSSKTFEKDDNYVLEETLKKYSSTLSYPSSNVFLLKNKKWFQCSPDTQMMLIPCVGEYTDLTKY